MEKPRRKKRFKKTRLEWLKKRLANKKLYSADDLAVMFSIDPKTVNRLAREGKLKPIRRGPPFLFRPEALKGFALGKPGRPKKTNIEGRDTNVKKRTD